MSSLGEETNFGDGEWIQGLENSKWEKKKLNNVVFPYFPKNQSKTRLLQHQVQRVGLAATVQNNCDYSKELIFLECPLCTDILVQATTISCGHVFCYKCINAWKSYRNWCPICQSSISSSFSSGLIRVYILDELIEQVFWPQLSLNIRNLINEGRTERLIQLDLKRRDYAKSCCGKISNNFRTIRIHLGNKGWVGALAYTFHGFWNICCEFFGMCISALLDLNCKNVGNVLKMCALVLIGCLACGPCSLMSIPGVILEFFAYMIHCIYIYPGWSGDLIKLTAAGGGTCGGGTCSN